MDTTLPFELRSSPKIFNAVADALAYMIRKRGVQWLEHYLDDYVVVGPSNKCREDLLTALGTCEEVGFPVAGEKTGWPATTMTLLGIEFDSVNQVLRLPEEKLKRAKEAGSKLEEEEELLQEGASVPGRSSGPRMQGGQTGSEILEGLFSTFRRRDHFVRLNAAFRADLEWWNVFLAHGTEW